MSNINNELQLIVKRLKDCIERADISYAELEKRTGTPKSSIQRYANGLTKKIPVDFIISIAPVLQVTPEYLMGWSDNEETKPISELSDDIKKLLCEFYKLNQEGRDKLLETAIMMNRSGMYEIAKNSVVPAG